VRIGRRPAPPGKADTRRITGSDILERHLAEHVDGVSAVVQQEGAATVVGRNEPRLEISQSFFRSGASG
jgi:chromosome condensin MukBEF MukE localization factor